MGMIKYLLFFLVLLLTVNLVRTFLSTKRSLGRLENLRTEVLNLRAQVESLKKEEALKSSPQFLEREARDKLGLIKKGEKVVILPETDFIGNPAWAAAPMRVDKTANWKKWRRLLLE